MREVLDLPEPARTLLGTTFETIDNALAGVLPEGQEWRLGGGTLLAARWRHRRSTDVDIFLPESSGIAALDPRWNPTFAEAMSAVGATKVEVQDRSLKFAFPAGRVEITQLDLKPTEAPTSALIEGRHVAVYHNRQILTGKLYGRGRRLPARDIFDVAVAMQQDPDALRAAVNFLDRNLRTEIIHSIRTGAALYADVAPEAIIEPGPQWEHLIRDGPEQAIAAIQYATYRNTRIRYVGDQAEVVLTGADGWQLEESFASGQELAKGLTRFGLERVMLRSHRSTADFIADADAKLRGQ